MGLRSGTLEFSLGALEPAVQARLAALEQARFAARLWERDDALWGDDPARRRVAANRLGWLEVAGTLRAQTGVLGAFAAEVARAGYTRAVLLGMGGSSLAPEVLRATFGVAEGALDLTVLDNTSPEAVRAVAESHDPERTLFVVSSKSGGTLEVKSFEAYFHEWVRAARGDRAGESFVAVTDPDTPLQALARERGYRRVFTNPPDIGGRYSALSYFGLVPAALTGADLEGLLEAALEEARQNQPGVRASDRLGTRLGAVLGEAALHGRDKLTLVLGPEIAAFGSWIEQLIAESTGKEGRGIVPVAEERLAGPEAYGADRVFVALSVGRLDAPSDTRLRALGAAGHPVVRGTLPSAAALGAEFLRWEIATATAGAVIDVNPFDEPNVTEAKQATDAVLEDFRRDGALPARRPLATAGGLEVEAPERVAEALRARLDGRSDPAAWPAALPAIGRPGDYVAVLAYLRRTPARHERLERLRHAARAASRLATTLGYGPRFLHSTGQLHKGGPDTGLFLQLTADEGEDLPIPGRDLGFATLRAAQALGDYRVLERRGRRVLHVHLGADIEASLDLLVEALEGAARTTS